MNNARMRGTSLSCRAAAVSQSLLTPALAKSAMARGATLAAVLMTPAPPSDIMENVSVSSPDRTASLSPQANRMSMT